MMNAYIAMHCACVDRMSNDEETRANTVSCSECKDVTQRGHVQNAVISCSKCGKVMFKTEMWEIHAQLPRLLSVLNCAESMSTTHPAWVPMDVYPHACPAHRNMMLKTQSEMSAWKKSILAESDLHTGIGFGSRPETKYIPCIFCSNASCSGKSIWLDFRSCRLEFWMDLITKWHGTSQWTL